MQDIEIMQQCLEVGQEAYRQEVKRQDTIVTKAEYLMKYHTLLIAILNLSLPLLLKYAELKSSVSWMIFYVLTMLMLLSGIIFTLFIQQPKKIKLFPTSASLLKKIQKDAESYQTEEDWIYKKILFYEQSTVTLENANNSSIKWIKKAYIVFVLSIVMLGFFFGNIIFRNF